VVEREREIEKFDVKSSFKVSAVFDLGKGKLLVAELAENWRPKRRRLISSNRARVPPLRFPICKETRQKIAVTSIHNVNVATGSRAQLGFSVSQTMVVAQKLYEAGKISYMRTDSLNLSDEAVQGATRQIETAFGKEFVFTRKIQDQIVGSAGSPRKRFDRPTFP